MSIERSFQEKQTHRLASGYARIMLDHMGQFVGLLDVEGHLLEANRAALEAAQVSREQVIGRLFWETPWWNASADVQMRLKDAIRRAAQGEFIRFETQHCIAGRPGESITVDFSLKPIFDDNGQVLYLLPQGREIADKEKAESYALLRAVTEGTTDAAFVKDIHGRYLMVNTAGSRLLGKSVSEVVGKTDAELFTPESAQRIRQIDQAIMAEGQTRTHGEVNTSAGVTRTYLVTKGPYRDAQGQTIGLWGVSRDVTESKLADETLRHSEAKYRQIVETATEGIWMVDAQCKTVYANQHLAKLLGYTIEELLGQDPLRFAAPESVAEFQRSFADIRRGVRTLGELALLRKDGSTIWAILSNNVIYDPQGRYGGALGMFTDITARKRIEAQMEQLNRDLQRKVSELQTLLDIVPMGIAVAEDAQCFSIWGNRTFTQMLGVASNTNLSKSHPASRSILHHRYFRNGREVSPD
ncbi:MAG: PAS domain S-box protein, partial [Bacillota bacterium]